MKGDVMKGVGGGGGGGCNEVGVMKGDLFIYLLIIF